MVAFGGPLPKIFEDNLELFKAEANKFGEATFDLLAKGSSSSGSFECEEENGEGSPNLGTGGIPKSPPELSVDSGPEN